MGNITVTGIFGFTLSQLALCWNFEKLQLAGVQINATVCTLLQYIASSFLFFYTFPVSLILLVQISSLLLKYSPLFETTILVISSPYSHSFSVTTVLSSDFLRTNNLVCYCKRRVRSIQFRL